MTELQPDLELSHEQADRLLDVWRGDGTSCTGIHRLKGGMVNSVFRLDLDQPPHHVVVKIHEPGDDSFDPEVRALRHLRRYTDCPVPQVHLHDASAEHVPFAFLLLEHVPGECLDQLELPPDERADVDRQLAELLVELHGHTATTWGGITTPERTTPWADVMVGRLRRVRARPTVGQRLAPDVLATVDRAIEQAADVLDDPGVPTLVHGDVWDGNVMVERRDGRWRITALLDPAAEYADPEMEIAYLEVFGHEQDAFLAAYTEHRQLRPGYERRRVVHWLHTALVHVALFDDEYFRDYAAWAAAEILRQA